jgi:tetratricopeptide (TPR) repeat protein
MHHSTSQPDSTSFRLHISEQQIYDVELSLQQPVHQLAAQLAAQYQLPPAAGGYTLYGGAERRPIGHERPLSASPYAGGGDLYLAPRSNPWWLVSDTAPVATPARSRAGLRLPNLSTQQLTFGGIGLLMLGLLLFMLWPRETSGNDVATQEVTLQPPTAVAAQATATLLPATPTPPATPTLEPAAAASVNYQAGVAAYDEQDWELAVEHLEAVYAYNPLYLDCDEVLAATHFNWGVSLRDGGDIAAADEQFLQALRVDAGHSLADEEHTLADLYLEARDAEASGDDAVARDLFRELLQARADYADAADRLYALLIDHAIALREEGGESNLRAALALYREAAGLEVADTGTADKGAAVVADQLPRPTATPRPQPTTPPRPPGRLYVSKVNENDDPSCISMHIAGVIPSGWYFSVDGFGLHGSFDTGGNARACGLPHRQEVTITIIDGRGSVVSGGSGIPSRGSAIMYGEWR